MINARKASWAIIMEIQDSWPVRGIFNVGNRNDMLFKVFASFRTGDDNFENGVITSAFPITV